MNGKLATIDGDQTEESDRTFNLDSRTEDDRFTMPSKARVTPTRLCNKNAAAFLNVSGISGNTIYKSDDLDELLMAPR